jgi:outer membrane protein assembly factor BamB
MGRRSRWLFAITTLAILAASLVLARRPGNGSAGSPEQKLLDTRLVWAEPAASPMWPALVGSHGAYLWDRVGGADCTTIGGAGPPQRWRAEGARTTPASPPVMSEERVYIAGGYNGSSLYAYGLNEPYQSTLLWESGVAVPVRKPLWRGARPGVVTGTALDHGILYVTAIPWDFGGLLAAIDAASGKELWQARTGLTIGAPAIATLRNGTRAVIVADTDPDNNGWAAALDAVTGQQLWLVSLSLRPIAAPVVTEESALVCGLTEDDLPRITALDLETGAAVWMFLADHPVSPGIYASNLNPKRSSPLPDGSGDISPLQPGGIVVFAGAGSATGYAFFACGNCIYAFAAANGRLLWKHVPDIPAGVLRALVTTAGKPTTFRRGDELPPAPWVTAPAVWREQVLFGTPDGLTALADADGRPLWHLRGSEVGAVDMPPRIVGDIAYISSQGWVGGPRIPGAHSPVSYAIRLDGAGAVPVLTAPPLRMRRWASAGGTAVLLLLTVAIYSRRRTASSRAVWPEAIAMLFLAGAVVAVPAIWVGLHQHSAGSSITLANPTVQIYKGATPRAMLLTEAALLYLAALLAVWRRQKLAFAAATCLVIGAALVAVWVRSFRAGERISVFNYALRPDRVAIDDWFLLSESGGIMLGCREYETPSAVGLVQARKFDRIRWSRNSFNTSYPLAGPLLTPVESGVVHAWRGFEAQTRATADPLDATNDHRDATITFPDWSVLPVLAVFPAACLSRAVMRRRIRRRIMRGCCRVCTYNLKGNESGTCPECGTPVTVPAQEGRYQKPTALSDNTPSPAPT